MADVRWMTFVDGENVSRQRQDYLRGENIEISEGAYWRPDVFLWMPDAAHVERLANYMGGLFVQEHVRGHYYTSVPGGEPERDQVRDQLRAIGFESEVFRRPARGTGRASKGVDIALTTNMLSHAFLDNNAIAVRVAGDGDYVPLVEAVKRQGKRAHGLFYSNGASPELVRACDRFTDLGPHLAKWWRRHNEQPR